MRGEATRWQNDATEFQGGWQQLPLQQAPLQGGRPVIAEQARQTIVPASQGSQSEFELHCSPVIKSGAVEQALLVPIAPPQSRGSCRQTSHWPQAALLLQPETQWSVPPVPMLLQPSEHVSGFDRMPLLQL
jgi:hypothetical protein